jgi:hypothetical protein
MTPAAADVLTATAHALWRIGRLAFFCSAIQCTARALVYEHPSRRVVWETNRRFGKTRTCVTISGEMCLAFPGVRVPYAAPTATQVRTFVHPPMLELTNTAPPDIAPELVGGEWVFPPLQWFDAKGNPVRTKLHGGAEVARFKGKRAEELLCMSRVAPHGCEDAKKADALRGTGTVFAVLDEVRDIPIVRYVLSSVVGPMLWEARSRWHDAVKATMLVASTTPSEPDHPFVEIADAAEAKGAYFHATIYDCDHLDERAIEDAKEEAGGEDTIQWRVEALAERVRDPRVVAFCEFDRAVHVGARERPSHFFPAVIADGAYIDQQVHLFGFYSFEDATYVIEDERVFQRTRSDIVSEAVSSAEAELWPGLTVGRRRIDAPPQVRADMNREEWGAPEAWDDETREPPHWGAVTKPRSSALGSFEAGVNRVRVLLKGGRILIHPRCKTLIAQTNAARWNAARSEFERVSDEKGQVLHHFDAAAALVYFVRDASTANPTPAPELRSVDRVFRAHRMPDRDRELRNAFRRAAR